MVKKKYLNSKTYLLSLESSLSSLDFGLDAFWKRFADFEIKFFR